MRKVVSVICVIIALLFAPNLIIQFKALWSWMCKTPESTASFLMSLVLAAGLYVAYRQLKLVKKTAQAELMRNMSEYWDSQMKVSRMAVWKNKNADALFNALEEYREKGKIAEWITLTSIGDFFELMGNLAHSKALDLNMSVTAVSLLKNDGIKKHSMRILSG